MRKLTQEEYIDRATIVHNNEYDYKDVVYIKGSEKINVICKKHGVFRQQANSHLRGISCPKCSREKVNKQQTKTEEEFFKKVKEVHGDRYTYDISNGIANSSTITITCKKHGEFKQTVKNHLSKKENCPKCSKEKSRINRKKDTEYFIKESNRIHKDRYDYSEVKYTRRRDMVDIICKEHGVFSQVAGNHMQGVNCPKCSNAGPSEPEQEVFNYISSKIKAVQGSRSIITPKELDIVIPSKNIALEFNGLYYHSDKFKLPNYHLDKTNNCENKGIQLIHIFEDEWSNKREIVKSRLDNIIGKTNTVIYARKCVVKEVKTAEAMIFLQQNHIQGKVGAKVKIGLYYEDKLVSLMTFGKLRKNLGNSHKEGHWELIRFCNVLNTTVVGGASKLLKFFENQNSPKEIISYADKRWSKGNLYEKLGFSKIHESIPNYFYITQSSPDIREPRYKFRKDILVSQGEDKNKTEKEIMKDRGYYRIYDCGAIKYKLTY